MKGQGAMVHASSRGGEAGGRAARSATRGASAAKSAAVKPKASIAKKRAPKAAKAKTAKSAQKRTAAGGSKPTVAAGGKQKGAPTGGSSAAEPVAKRRAVTIKPTAKPVAKPAAKAKPFNPAAKAAEKAKPAPRAERASRAAPAPKAAAPAPKVAPAAMKVAQGKAKTVARKKADAAEAKKKQQAWLAAQEKAKAEAKKEAEAEKAAAKKKAEAEKAKKAEAERQNKAEKGQQAPKPPTAGRQKLVAKVLPAKEKAPSTPANKGRPTPGHQRKKGNASAAKSPLSVKKPKGLFKYSHSGPNKRRQKFAMTPDRRKKRTPWAEEEEEAIRKGVKKYGTSWSQILREPEFSADFHSSRTDVDLKDKWRNMNKFPKENRAAKQPQARSENNIHFRNQPGENRKPRERWDEDEEQALRHGVKEYGEGEWSTILLRCAGFKQARTTVDLKDKWRNIKKAAFAKLKLEDKA